MKKFFRGFTLAELLLCVGIIGIVSAMGMTVAKIGTDKAYNSYYYAGYINLYNAIADAKSQGKETNSDIMNHARDLLSKDNVVANFECPAGQEKVNGVCQDICPEGQTRDENGVCRAPEEEQEAFVWPTPDNSVVIETVNGIKYYYPNNLSDGMNGVQQLTGEISGVTNAFPITMTVPQRQTRANNGIATVHLIYIDLNGGYLIPVTDDASVDLQNRRDLLPAYIDNGKVGRNSNIINRNNWTYERPAYRSYRETYCLLRGRTVINNVISCDGISVNQAGVLAIANPQKAR